MVGSDTFVIKDNLHTFLYCQGFTGRYCDMA